MFLIFGSLICYDISSLGAKLAVQEGLLETTLGQLAILPFTHVLIC